MAFTACDIRRGRAQLRLCQGAATFPVTDCLATLRVLGPRVGTGSRVEWSARFTPRGVSDQDASELLTASPREACRRWSPNSHPLRQSPGRSVSGLREPSRLQAKRPEERSAAASEGGRGMARDSPDANARTRADCWRRRGSRLATQGG